jgi:hypothetical protein
VHYAGARFCAQRTPRPGARRARSVGAVRNPDKLGRL